ncbi:MAG: prephenate dehydrogenase/arogenate dehydrogenase family protein, partial [Bacteroidales bacterium]|nr:prephenate dehydrogenase/arogenate dehydrogenase family protein [Bacteroidales bacterium]
MKVGIIGLGLMGGSFGRTLVKQGLATVFGYDIDPSVMEKGLLLRAYNYALTEENARNLDVLIVATVPKYFYSSVNKFAPYLKRGAIVTDFCGIKRKILTDMKRLSEKYSNLVFVGGHPMAGREFSGIDHAVTTLFDKASMILVPYNADIFALDKIKKFYLSAGFSEVVITDADNHDSMIAYTSQLCHIVSNAFIKNEQAEKHSGYSAGSYKDLTRVARLNPDMWTELMSDNRDKILSELEEFIANVTKYRDAIKNNDDEELKRLLAEGNERKLKID